MLVEPVPISPRGRRGRLAAIASLAGLVGVLAGAVALAQLDRAGPDQRPRTAISSAPTPSGPAPVSSGLAPGPSGLPPEAAPATASIPRAAFGLRVRTVTEAIRARLDGDLREGLAAVSGFLTGEAGAPECGGAPGAIGDALCQRVAILRAMAPVTGTATGPMLIAWIPPGTPLLESLTPEGATPVAIGSAVRVVIIGRFETPPKPCLAPSPCGSRFIVERLAWADGTWRARVVVRDPAIADPAGPSDELARLIASREADRSETVLSQAVVGVEVLRTIDPLAAAQVPGPTAGLVWYVRSVASPRVGDGQRLVAWVVIDDQTGLILASGPPPTG